jgi:hypothetical protein
MKKISKDSGVRTTNKSGIRYIDRLRNAPDSEIKRSSLVELIQKVEEARAPKVEKSFLMLL